MYTFDEKFKKGVDRAFRAQQGLTVFLSGLNKILPEPPGFKTEKPKDSCFAGPAAAGCRIQNSSC